MLKAEIGRGIFNREAREGTLIRKDGRAEDRGERETGERTRDVELETRNPEPGTLAGGQLDGSDGKLEKLKS
jgi:hypothetical protein